MKILLRTFVLFIVIFSFSSCNKAINESDSHLIFGRYCGECFGDACVNIFKLTASKVFEDQNHFLPSTFSSGEQFDFEEMPNSKFEEVSSFIDIFPMDLIDETDDKIGCPDCYDQCGYFVQWKEDDLIRTWTIDTRKEDIPESLHEFVDQLLINVNLLKD